jgi:maltose alpha-D-glucosyltransferase/alpha-amylase
MRLNLGIRRRLAPLLDNDRARIELANSLLFTLPGAPVVYYGDEIGMGDNIWLDDRDGVRTPMQWSGAANAGFSVADPGTLYCPAIDDGVYGYRRVNVEAQRADPDSLWNRMREMIRIRKAHPALGRGGVRFLEPDNRAVLAYLRTEGDETVLSINNLSPERQTFALDGGIPPGTSATDLLSGKKLPPIESIPRSLTLERYGFAWLKLDRPV